MNTPQRSSRVARLVIIVLSVMAVTLGVWWIVKTPAGSGGRGSTPRFDVSRDAGPAEPEVETLQFDIREGNIRNHFYRRGPIAAHLLATSGKAPRLIVAFPAENSGIGVWFDELAQPAELVVKGELEGVERNGMRGVRATLESTATHLSVQGMVLSSVRVLRDYVYTHDTPDTVRNEIRPGPPLVVSRATVDGRHHYELTIEPLEGATIGVDAAAGHVEVAAREGADRLRFTIVALNDERPLTPIPQAALVTDRAANEPRALRALAFLTYEEKLLAGSWRFLTYFGRDSLLSVRLLMPVLRPTVVEAGLGAVLERLDPNGEVAHEEDIGEFAALRNSQATPPPADLRTPIYDYKMVDDDFLLAPVAAHYLLESEDGRARAAEFLARRTTAGQTFEAALKRNIEMVLRRARPFAASPVASNLIALRDNIPVGDWRDSNEGLARGRIAFDVNAALVPAALDAAARLLASPILGPDTVGANEARQLAEAWKRAPDLFRVEIPAAVATERVRAYATAERLDPAPALDALDGAVVFPGIALDARGRPIPVMHSDDGFVMLFTSPSPEELDRIATRIARPFPAGLRTGVGVVVANPAYAPDAATRGLFTRGHYHGTVVWSWQQAMLAAGLRRQLERSDVPRATRDALERAERVLWDVIDSARAMSTSELWSWSYENGNYRIVPFGQGGGHVDESNAAQLWSTVYLAVQRPRR